MKTWKDGINDRPPREELLADGFPPPADPVLEAWLRWLYAEPTGEEASRDLQA